MHRRQNGIDILLRNHGRKLAIAHVTGKSEMDGSALEDVPGFSFAVRSAHVLECELVRGVDVHGEAFAGIEHLDQ